MKKNKDYLIITIYGLLLIITLLGFNNIYGADIDWLTQHTVFPDYFRNYFYETGKFIPNFLFNLGGGQNIYNFSYYGLMSPIILISYLLPFLSMRNFVIIASIILYLSSGLLLYKFFSNKYSKKISLYSSLILLSLAPLTYHFHYHIMFVWYFPFLILSFIGVDKYIDENKSFLLMLGIFLILMTNYYYGVPSILAIVVYGAYKLLSKYKDLKTFITDILKASIRIIIPILLSCIILLPTMYSLTNTSRVNTFKNSISDLLVFNIKEGMYSSFSTGITAIFIIAILVNIFNKKKRAEDLFLNITLALITFIPIFMYILNGFLYARGKVLIPFIILFMIALANFISKLDKTYYKKVFIISIITTIFTILTNLKSELLILFLIDTSVSLIVIYLYQKNKKLPILMIPIIILILTSSFINNTNSKYLTKDKINELDKQETTIKELINSIDDKDFYRIDINTGDNRNVNKVYNYDFYKTTIYSSSYNSKYHDFYNFKSGNNITARNLFITNGTNNPLFNNFMGVKYLITKTDAPLNYKKIKSNKDFTLYKNESTYPVIYATTNYGSNKQYDNLLFPYNLEYMLNNPIVNDTKSINYNSKIKKLDLNLSDKYEFNIKKTKTYTKDLPTPINNKYLIISFDMNYNQSCKDGDVSISINGIKNKLTCEDWYYHNKNNTFEYVISSNENINNLKIKFTKGKYNISNINVYTMDNIIPTYKSLENIKINKKTSSITGNIDLDKESLIVTSIPYDDGFEITVDGKPIEKEIVNKSFLGFNINKGKHNINITYTSPYYKLGKLVSICGFIIMIIVLIIERNINKRSN